MIKYLIEFFTIKQVYGTILTLILGTIIYKLIYKAFEKIVIKGKDDFEKKRRKTVVNIIQNVFKYVYVILIIIILLQIFGVDTKNFIAGLGIAGVVIGLALQDALKDIISGVSIIMDDYFVVGDIVEIKGFKGKVISLGLKATMIENENGTINVLTNRTIDNVINYSKKSPKLILITSISGVNKQETVEKHLIKLCEELNDLKNVKDVKYLGIEEILDNNVNYAIEVNCQRGQEDVIKREFNKKIKVLLDNEKLKK